MINKLCFPIKTLIEKIYNYYLSKQKLIINK